MSCHFHQPHGVRLLPSLLVLCCALAKAANAGEGESAPSAGASKQEEVSLAELLAHARAHAPAASIAALRRRYGAAERASAAPLFGANPSLELGIGPRFSGPGQRDFDFVAALAQPLEIAGQRAQRKEAAARLGDVLAAEQTASAWSLRRDITRAYRRAALLRGELELARANAAFARRLLEIARQRLQAGDASLIELHTAEADVAEAETDALTAAHALFAARLELAALSGWSRDEPPMVVLESSAPRPVPELERLIAGASNHPDVSARRAAAAEASARATLSEREAWPSPAIGVQVVREGGSSGSPANYIVLGTLEMELPLWQRNAGGREKHRIDADLARLEADHARTALRMEVTRARAALVTAGEKLALMQASVAGPIEESLRLLQRGFEAGELELDTVASATERLLRARRAALSAHADYFEALADLEFALGAELPAAGQNEGSR